MRPLPDKIGTRWAFIALVVAFIAFVAVVIRLPEDVQVGEKILFPSCRLPDECPIAPLYPLTTGGITLWIDSRGIVFQENPDDVKAFPFLDGSSH